MVNKEQEFEKEEMDRLIIKSWELAKKEDNTSVTNQLRKAIQLGKFKGIKESKKEQMKDEIEWLEKVYGQSEQQTADFMIEERRIELKQKMKEK